MQDFWISRAEVSLSFFPQYKLPQMRVIYSATYYKTLAFFVEYWLHLHLISFRTVNLKIQVLNLFKNRFREMYVPLTVRKLAPQVKIFANVLSAGIKKQLNLCWR